MSPDGRYRPDARSGRPDGGREWARVVLVGLVLPVVAVVAIWLWLR